MVTEDYVSFETAKLLKEKGFDSDGVGCLGGFYSERCYESGHGITTQSGQEVGIVYDDLTNSDLEYDEYLRPTLQMAMKWLREKYNLHIVVDWRYDTDPSETNNYSISYMYVISSWNSPKEHFEETSYKTYEQVCEAAIKYCLENLI